MQKHTDQGEMSDKNNLHDEEQNRKEHIDKCRCRDNHKIKILMQLQQQQMMHMMMIIFKKENNKK